MTITGTFLDKGISNVSSQLQSVQDSSFGKTFEEVSSKKGIDSSAKNADRKQNANKSNVASSKAKDSKEAYDKSKVNNNVETKAEETRTESNAGEVTTTQADKAVESEKISEQIVEEVAASLEIPPEALMEILAALNITPMDLMDTKNVNLVVQKLMGAENSIELLSMEGVSELLTKIEEAVETAIEMPIEETLVENVVPQYTEIAEEEVVSTVSQATVKPLEQQKTIETTDLASEFSETEIQFNEEAVLRTDTQSTDGNTESGEESSLFGSAEVDVNIENNVEVDASFSAQYVENSTINSVASSRVEAIRFTNPQEVTSQIIERVKVDIKPGVSEIRMNLKPESLGEVSLRIASENGVVTAHFVAENQKVKEIIENNFNQLQDALSEQGVNITELSVSVSNGDSERQMQEFIQGRAKSQSRISSIISGINENGELLAAEPDESEIYDNNVNYKV